MNAVVQAAGQAAAKDAAQERNQYLTFMLGGEIFAIGILHIKEIIEYGQLTSVPMMPGFIRGVINLRGAVVPVIDLSRRFGGAGSEITRRSCIVIVEAHVEDDTRVLGVVVDAVNAVLEISASEIEPAPAFGAKIRTDFIAGMGKIGDRFAILLDVDRVLSVEEMAALSGAAGDARPSFHEPV
ncbi:chemotaxis protein CheW [Acidovorax sp. ACV01]|uniref:chemotaxis protein CheW n=1 Tax=Acidovorax sp. ACV01 TaxID=2769311 RepID=UPI00177D16ED|nr:chemotaxis protein CheW [Acidovorax sp. ACV01]MBD9391468.1 purine-binding chemotaxis protein CheW [Acidovorax sp. ACV01]